jgi:hypothetical protein
MEKDPLAQRATYLRRRGAVVNIIDGKLDVLWGIKKKDGDERTVGIQQVTQGEGKKAPRSNI